MRNEYNAADLDYMRRSIELARKSLASGDHPVGALVVDGDEILAEGTESTRRLMDITAHAEVEALRAACRHRGTLDLSGTTLYTTVEPCYLCSFAIRQLRVSRVVIGRAYPEAGGVSSRHPLLTDPNFPHWPAPPAIVTGVLAAECAALFAKPA
ncbi:MAG: nucleoside deaminase [Bryobacterales bacterium]|nr:nucleoside deaminase [Bryobacterales bacterium]